MLPVKHDGWDEADPCCIQLYDVEFLENFGKIEKGKKFQSTYIDYGKGIISCLNEGETGIEGDRQEEVEIRFKAVAID